MTNKKAVGLMALLVSFCFASWTTTLALADESKERVVSVRLESGRIVQFVARPIFEYGSPDTPERFPSVYSENCRKGCAALDAGLRARDEMVSARAQAGGVSPFEIICKKLKGKEAFGRQLPEQEGSLSESFCYFRDSHHPERSSYINTAELWRMALKNSGH